jgi:hypothetical protein
MTLQHPFLPAAGPYGSSALSTGPHTDGTRWSFVLLQCRIRLPGARQPRPPAATAWGAHLEDASLTRMRERPRSSRRRWLCSSRRRSLSSDIDCFARELMAGCGWRGGYERAAIGIKVVVMGGGRGAHLGEDGGGGGGGARRAALS